MSVAVFAAPYTPPRPKVAQPFTRTAMTWTGTDDITRNLSDWREGIILLRDGLEGLHLPEWAEQTSEAAGADGQQYHGGRARGRHVEWPVYLWADSSSGWKDIESAWWKSFYPLGEYGTWTVTTGDETRRLRCRLTSDGGYAHDRDPQLFGWCRYPVSLMADDPYWLGDPIELSWDAPNPRLFFGGGDPADPEAIEAGPPFGITAQTNFDTAAMSNPGDVPRWPVWTFVGPATDTIVTVDGGPIGIPVLAAGDELIFDTDPANGEALLNGVNVDGQILPWDPRPIPPGAEVEVTVQRSQLASLRCAIEPAYYRALS